MKNNTFLNFEIPIEIWSLLDLQKFGSWQIVKSDMFLPGGRGKSKFEKVKVWKFSAFSRIEHVFKT